MLDKFCYDTEALITVDCSKYLCLQLSSGPIQTKPKQMNSEKVTLKGWQRTVVKPYQLLKEG